MQVIIQRVKKARVYIENEPKGEIAKGIVIFLGISNCDKDTDIDYLVNKICNLRIFEDNKGKMNFSLKDIKGECLIISEFTLLADCRKGNRPSFNNAADLKLAKDLYDKFVEKIKLTNLKIITGEFASKMLVEIHNDGPVTFILSS